MRPLPETRYARWIAWLRAERSWRTGATIAGLAFIVLFALWKLPAWQVTHTPGTTAQNRFDREDAARKTLAQIIGGIVILGGLYMSFKTFGLSREGQITDRFTKAIEQLGKTDNDKPNIEVRLGAIYALERIAFDSPRDHWTIMEVLTAYVRQNAPILPDTPCITGDTPRTDIQAILTVIGRRKTGTTRERPNNRIDLTHSNLNRVNLKDASLRGSELQGSNLQGALLDGADLQLAVMRRVNLQEASLRNANLQHVNLDHANLQHTCLDEACLRGVDLYRANLQNADLQKADLQDAFLAEANFHQANLGNADLRRADLINARLDGADIDYADLRDAKWLNVEQIQFATNWEYAQYTSAFRVELGLPAPVVQPR